MWFGTSGRLCVKSLNCTSRNHPKPISQSGYAGGNATKHLDAPVTDVHPSHIYMCISVTPQPLSVLKMMDAVTFPPSRAVGLLPMKTVPMKRRNVTASPGRPARTRRGCRAAASAPVYWQAVVYTGTFQIRRVVWVRHRCAQRVPRMVPPPEIKITKKDHSQWRRRAPLPVGQERHRCP